MKPIRRTAWLLAHAYCEVACIDADTAFRLLIVDHREAVAHAHAHTIGLMHDAA